MLRITWWDQSCTKSTTSRSDGCFDPFWARLCSLLSRIKSPGTKNISKQNREEQHGWPQNGWAFFGTLSFLWWVSWSVRRLTLSPKVLHKNTSRVTRFFAPVVVYRKNSRKPIDSSDRGQGSKTTLWYSTLFTCRPDHTVRTLNTWSVIPVTGDAVMEWIDGMV